MGNEAISALLNHICSEARRSAHASFGALNLLASEASSSERKACLDLGRRSADRLLRSVDDVLELLSADVTATRKVELFEPAECLADVVHALNWAAPQPGALTLGAPSGRLVLRQDRRAVEQVLTRVLRASRAMAGTAELRTSAGPCPRGHGIRFIVRTPARVGRRIVEWLNMDLEHLAFERSEDMLLQLSTLIAGTRLRALGGSAGILRQTLSSCDAALLFPSLPLPDAAMGPGPLNVLLAENAETSSVSEQALVQECHLWRCHNRREILELIQRQPFDLILIDSETFKGHTLDVVQAVREWETRVAGVRSPIFLLTSYHTETPHDRAAQAGCSGFLRKPLREGDIGQVLADLNQGD
jgi:CheY-like chemotaxis protein